MSKLHPIYVALDSFQYNRAIKLATALPDSNVLGKCLLAHAYYKSGQRYPSMVTLNKIFSSLTGPGNYFCELEREVRFSIEAIEEEQQQQQQQQQEGSKPSSTGTDPSSSTSKKGGKKGPKKKTPTPAVKPSSTTPTTDIHQSHSMDLVERLDSPPLLEEDWDKIPSTQNAITDEVRTCRENDREMMMMMLVYEFLWPSSFLLFECWV